MKPIRIIDVDFNLLAEIDDYESLIWTRRWHMPGEFEFHINFNKQGAANLQTGHLVLLGAKAGIILHRELQQGPRGKGEEQVVVKGAALVSVVGRRLTIPPEGYAYDRVNAAAETIMKGYVNRNCLAPIESKRIIPSLEVAIDQQRGAKIVYQSRYKQLDEELEKLSLISGLGWDVALDWENKKWVFDVLEGRNLTADQGENPPVIFAAEFDAVQAQGFVESFTGHKNTAYVGGQGEGISRDVAEVGSHWTGLERREIFVDARDIEEAAELPGRGLQKLAEVTPALTFDTEILTQGPYRYGQDWDLGDVVTIQNRRWGVTLDSRITEVTEIYEPSGFALRVTFGSNIPTLAERIKQELDAPMIEKGLLEKGETGPPGAEGVGLDYAWVGTKLGVKREDEPGYNYTDLQGPAGAKGDKGDIGDPGSTGAAGQDGAVGPPGQKGEAGADGVGLLYNWQGTALGIKRENETGYSYSDIQGPQGGQGLKGDKGEKGDPGSAGAKGDKGDKGDPGAAGAKGDKGEKGDPGLAGAKGDKGDRGAPGPAGAKGDKGDKGDPGPAGAKGDKGEKGDPGSAGAAGQDGAVGPPGQKGDAGADGVGFLYSWQGTTLGIKRENEIGYSYSDLQGPQGEQGLKGDKGDKGDPGSAGAKGDKGDKGDPGAAGAKGDKGEKGDPGLAGAKGDKGDRGPKGDKGDAGAPGTDAEVTENNVLAAIGYVPVNRAGDIMTGSLQIDSVKLGSYSIAHNGPTGSLELSLEGAGKYLAFDGTGSYVDIPNQNLLSTWTAECWLYHEPAFASYETVIAGDVDEKYIMLLANGRPNLYYTGLIAPSMILPGWTHLASTCDGNRSKIYVNGVEVASKTAARTIKATTLGARPERTGEWLKGGLRDVRLWSIARTARQIEDNMNEQLTGNESGLVGLWMLDEGTGTTLQDLAQNNHGSTVNACWEDGVNTPILSLQLDKNARFAKKIEAGTQTAAGDSDSVIATKKYVDDKAAAGGIQIGVGIVEPSGLIEGDWWYKEA